MTRQSLVFAGVRPCGSVRWVPVVVGHGEEVCEAGFGPAAAYRSVRGVGCPWGPDPALCDPSGVLGRGVVCPARGALDGMLRSSVKRAFGGCLGTERR